MIVQVLKEETVGVGLRVGFTEGVTKVFYNNAIDIYLQHKYRKGKKRYVNLELLQKALATKLEEEHK